MEGSNTASETIRQRRILACTRCHKRKLKCDRQFPCAHCRMVKTECVPTASVPRQRRRRFAEKDLLTKLQEHEDLLRQHHIAFTPLHDDGVGGHRNSLRGSETSIRTETETLPDNTVAASDTLYV